MPVNVLVTGSHGFVGSALVPFLTSAGLTVQRLIRSESPTAHSGITWSPPKRGPDPVALTGVEAVVHLAGESVASRWTEAKKRDIRDSRIQGTRLLVAALAQMNPPPKTLICASAIGYYGNRGAEKLQESSSSGQGFLAEVCRQWEATAQAAAQRGIRVVCLRIGFVLSPKGGGLKQMLLPFRLGVGGVMGSGDQYLSWVALDDLLGAILHAIRTESLRGPVNVVAPQPVTNREFTKTLGSVLHRPTLFPMPGFAARLAFGPMADELLLSSQRVEPAQLSRSGYRFQYPVLEPALRHLL